MRLNGRGLIVGAFVCAAIAAAPGGATRPAKVRLTIGKAALTPAHALSSKRFVVSYRVTRSDTRRSLKSAKVTATASIAGKAIRAAGSFRGGRARVSVVVPADAMVKQLTLRTTVKSDGRTARKTATFPIRRGQPLPSLSIGDATVTEGQTGTTAMSFAVTLSAADVQPVSVAYATADGTATAPGDYAAASGTLTFAPGTTTQTITVQAVGEMAIEPDEAFTVVLSSPVTATIADGTATGTITNDDFPPRAGYYSGAGMTFELLPDLTHLRHVAVYTNLKCTGEISKVDGFGASLNDTVVAPDGTFVYSWHLRTSTVTILIDGTGRLDPPDRASGGFSVVDSVHASDGNYDCKGGASWNIQLVGERPH